MHNFVLDSLSDLENLWRTLAEIILIQRGLFFELVRVIVNLRSRDMTSCGSVVTVMSLVRNGEDIVTEHWYDPASARERAEN